MSSVAEIIPAARSMIYLGMDVHKDSITIAVLPAGAKSPLRQPPIEHQSAPAVVTAT